MSVTEQIPKKGKDRITPDLLSDKTHTGVALSIVGLIKYCTRVIVLLKLSKASRGLSATAELLVGNRRAAEDSTNNKLFFLVRGLLEYVLCGA